MTGVDKIVVGSYDGYMTQTPEVRYCPTPKTIAWLLEADGTVTPLTAARKTMFGNAIVTHTDGRTEVTNALNVLAGDDLDRRYFW